MKEAATFANVNVTSLATVKSGGDPFEHDSGYYTVEGLTLAGWSTNRSQWQGDVRLGK